MSTVEKLLDQARRLSPRERRHLVTRLERSLSLEPTGGRRRRKETLHGVGPYAHSLALAGTVHASFGDVSGNKQRHVGEAAAARRRGS
jgi:hypothetical protein